MPPGPVRAEEAAGQLFPASLHPPHTQTNLLLPAGGGASEFTRAHAEEGCQEAFGAAPSLQIHLLWAPNRTQGAGELALSRRLWQHHVLTSIGLLWKGRWFFSTTST